VLLNLKKDEYLTTILPLGYPKSAKNGNTERKELNSLISYMN
jgi:hypothetical protein